jgi:polyisoprenyl-phosphate glycosyltransferase
VRHRHFARKPPLPVSPDHRLEGQPVYSFVIPLFNEEAVLPILFLRLDRLMAALDGPAEIILVDDGSSDTTGIFAAARARDDARYRYLALSRNFGQQIAITAGIDAAQGEAVIIMDADLQDPPEVALDMVAKWREGFEVVYAQRVSRNGDTLMKRLTADVFYRLVQKLTAVRIPPNVGDFRLIDRKAADAFRAMPERDRFVRGMFGWMGFRQTAVQFVRVPRAAGTTKYSWRKLTHLAFDCIVGFSDIPLRMALWVGGIVSLLALGYGFFVLVDLMVNGLEGRTSGWASTILVLSLIGGLNLITTGIIGLYVGRIHNEVKQRPLYLVGQAVGFETRGEKSGRADLAEGQRAEPQQRMHG